MIVDLAISISVFNKEMHMLVGQGDYQFQWIDNWASIPQTESGQANGRTHGVVVSETGHVLVFNQANPGVLVFDEAGKLQSQWGDRFDGAHGMTLVEEDETEYLWLTDQFSAEVVKTTLDGKTVMNLDTPGHDVYADGGKYSPTWVAVNEKRFGGNGDIWVADGYGCSLIHQYDQAGTYKKSISGQLGEMGRFACPHGIAFNYRGDKPELYVADRGNQRIQVFDDQGNYLRVVGARTLHSPCMFHFLGDLCLVPELFSRVDILDGDDNLVAILGDNGHVSQRAGWPNHNKTGNPQWIEPGLFNSPHGATFAPNGDIYVVEWIIGGRITKLAKQ